MFYQWVIDWELQQPQYVVDLPKGLARYQTLVAQRAAPTFGIGPVVAEKVGGFVLFSGWMAAAVVLLTLAYGWTMRDSLRYKPTLRVPAAPAPCNWPTAVG